MTLARHCLVWGRTLPRHCPVCVVTLQLLSCLWEDVTPSLSGLCGVVTTTVLSVEGRYPVTVWSVW